MAETQHETTIAPVPAPPTAPPGWTGAAMAIHAVRRMPTPMVVTLQP